MSVWTTLSENDTAEAAAVTAPLPEPGPTFDPGPQAPPSLTVVDEPVERPALSGRRALREARRRRQLTAAICVVVIAALLAVSIMIVGFARDRPANPSPSGAAAGTGLILSNPSL